MYDICAGRQKTMLDEPMCYVIRMKDCMYDIYIYINTEDKETYNQLLTTGSRAVGLIFITIRTFVFNVRGGSSCTRKEYCPL